MKTRIKKIFKSQFIKSIEMLIDLIIVFGSIFLYAIISYYAQNLELPNLFDKLIETIYSFASYIGYMAIVFILFRIYRPSIFERSFLSAMKSVTISLVLANMVLIILTFIVGSSMMMTPVGVGGILLIQLTLFTLIKYISSRYLSGLLLTKIMIIGIKEEVEDLMIDFFEDKDHNKFISYVIYELDGKVTDKVYELMKHVEDLYITPHVSDINKQKIMQYAIAQAGKDVHIIPKTYEISLINAKDTSIDDTLIFHIPMMRMSPEQRFIKRSFDIFVSGLAILFLMPFFLVLAIGIKLDDHGPVFYKQTRYKRNNEPFEVFKFRSMCVIQDEKVINKRATKNDSRITKMGKFLRASRFDELPQLINVLRGDMSLVGPRPLIKEEIDEAIKEIPEFYYRMNVKPGLTGLAQVKGKYDTKAKEKIRYDLLYVKKANFFFDIKILILTVKVLFSKGSVVDEGHSKTIYDYLNEHHLHYKESEDVMHIYRKSDI